MRYTEYENRIRRVGNALLFVKRHVPLMILLLSLLLGMTVGLLTYKGTFLEGAAADSYVYGEAPRFSARAFLSDVRFTFAGVGSEFFTPVEPKRPGSYVLQAESDGFLHNRVSTASFEIEKRELTLTAQGELPVIYTDEDVLRILEAEGLCEGDELVEASLDAASRHRVLRTTDGRMIDLGSDPFEPSEPLVGGFMCALLRSSLVIRNAAGEDVTDCYSIVIRSAYVEFKALPLTIVSNDIEKVYDKQPAAGRQVTIESGELAPGHVLSTGLSELPVKAGSFRNDFYWTITDSATGKDRSNLYDVSLRVGTVSVAPLPVRLISQDMEKVFDGEGFDYSDWSVTCVVTKDGEEFTTTLDGTQLVCAAGMPEGDELFLSPDKPEVTLAGTYQNSFSAAVYSDGVNVTGNYDLERVFGELTIKPGRLRISTGSAEKVYDGNPLTKNVWTLEEVLEGKIPEGWNLSVVVTGTITAPGETPNEAHLEEGDGVSENFTVQWEFGMLTVLENPDMPDPPSPQNTDTSIARQPFVPSIAPVASIFTERSLQLYLREQSYGDYTGQGFARATTYRYVNEMAVKPLAYTARTLRAAGVALQTVTVRPFMETERLVPDYSTNNIRTAGGDHSYVRRSVETTYDCYPVLEFDAITAGRKYYGNAHISPDYEDFVNATYRSVPASLRKVLKQQANAAGLHPGEPIETIAAFIRGSGVYNLNFAPYPDGVDMVEYFFTASHEGICQHFAAAGTMLFRYLGYAARYTVGYVAYAQAGVWTPVPLASAHAWVEVYVQGCGWIHVEVTPGTGAGFTPDSTQTDLPADIKLEPGGDDLPETRTLLTLQAASGEKEYDGLPLTVQGWWLREGTLKPGHRITARVFGSQTEIGQSASSIDLVRVFDEEGNDVSDQYLFKIETGTLTVCRRKITVVSASAEKIDDGKPLSAPYVFLSSGSLLAGHTLKVEVVGRQEGVGSSKNRITVYNLVEFTGQGDDFITVNDQYEVTFEFGTLTILPAE